MGRMVVFGTGLFWKNRKEIVNESEIVCFFDNSPKKIGTLLQGKPIVSPTQWKEYDYDYILLMSKQEDEMRAQLLSLGVPASKITSWEDYIRREHADTIRCLTGTAPEAVDVLIMTTAMGYNGGTNAIAYAARALMAQGLSVLVCTQLCDRRYLEELRRAKITVCEAPILEFALHESVRRMAEESRFVLVNVLQMFPVVRKLNGTRSVFWWIHEPQSFFDEELKKYPELADASNYNQVEIQGVGPIPNAAFNRLVPGRVTETLLYGIPDEANLGGGGGGTVREGGIRPDWRNHRTQGAGYSRRGNQAPSGGREEACALSHHRVEWETGICQSREGGCGRNSRNRIYGEVRPRTNQGGIWKNRCRGLPFEGGYDVHCCDGGADAWEGMHLKRPRWNEEIYYGWKRGICLQGA